MRIARWGAAAAVVVACVPGVAEAATGSPTGNAPAPGAWARQAVAAETGSLTPSRPATPISANAPTGRQEASAQDTTETSPAPAGSADAYAAKVGDIAAVSHTSASASGSGESATADPLELGGSNPPASQFGGTQTGSGTKSGAFFDTGTMSFGRLAITPWTATAGSSSTGNSASGLADIVLVDLGNPNSQQSVSLRVLQSESNATWDGQDSTGSSSSDGAILDIGAPNGLAVDVLHSQANSTGAGSSYLLSINGTQIGSSSQTNGHCSLTVPSLLALDCLTAADGTATNTAGDTVLTSSGGVLSAAVGPTTAGLVQAASTSAKAPARTPASSSPLASAAAAPSAPAVASAPGASASTTSSSLPFTGANIGLLVAAALVLAGAGFGLIAAARRPRLSRAARH